MEKVRQILFFKGYFLEFFARQSEKVKEKIDQVLYIITIVDRVPTKFLRHITESDGLYEIKVEFESNIYRIFCCFDKGKVVVLFNGFQKKTSKTPRRELDRANEIKLEYLNSKN